MYSQVIGAIAAEKFGGKIILGGGIFVTSGLTLLLPFCAHSLPLLYAVRALMGLGESVTYPAANVLYTKWAPAPERTLIVTLGSAGAYLGTAFAFPIAGFLIGPSSKEEPSKVAVSAPHRIRQKIISLCYRYHTLSGHDLCLACIHT